MAQSTDVATKIINYVAGGSYPWLTSAEIAAEIEQYLDVEVKISPYDEAVLRLAARRLTCQDEAARMAIMRMNNEAADKIIKMAPELSELCARKLARGKWDWLFAVMFVIVACGIVAYIIL